MKILWAVLLWLGVTTLASAETKVVPREVMVWYQDTMAMYAALVQGLDQAVDAKATAKVLRQATATAKTKQLAPRYRALRAQYPEFFGNNEGTDWVPPPDWIRVSQQYAATLANYGTGLQKAASWMGDPEVSQAFSDLGQTMAELGDQD